MKSFFKIGLTAAALAVGAMLPHTAATAGSMYDRGAGSLKDAPRFYGRPTVGNCYFRGDIGYSVSGDPTVTWPVSSYDATTGGYVYMGDQVSNESMSSAWMGEVGIGCGSGSRGFRADVTLGLRGSRDVEGEPIPFVPVPTAPPADDPLHTSVTSYTAMANVYYDLGKWHNFVPYVGAGVGVAYHKMDEVYFTGNPFLTNRIEGNNDISLAWSLMLGGAFQVSDRAIIDVGYRYINLGSIKSGRADSAGFVNPAVNVDDMTAHEFKVGLRYHFGGTGY